jgi:protein TonB
MDFDFQPKNSSRRYIGLGVVIFLHALIIWGLVSGLARKAVEIIKKPIEVAILTEMPPPPPPPPPKELKLLDKPPPVQPPPPPAYVPPPDVPPPPAPAAPVIQAVQAEPPKAPVEIKPAPPPAPPAPPAPAAPARGEIGINCPGYKEVLQNSLSGLYDRVGVTGVVKVQIRIHGNQIVDVTPVSGPREYYRQVQNAVRRMKCSVNGGDELLVPLEVSFREE